MSALTSPAHSQVADLTRFAGRPDLHGAATHFAVGHKCLRAGTDVDFELERLPAERTLNRFGLQHSRKTSHFAVVVQPRRVPLGGLAHSPEA
jgi:hypothetical protein